MEFLSTWQFWLGFTIGWILGFIIAAILAASGRTSRMEERMVGYKPPPKNIKRPNKPTPPPPPKLEIVTKNNPRTD